MGTRKRWTEGRKERDRGVQAEVCVCACVCVCVCVCGGWLLRFHMPTHSAPLRPLRPTFPDNEMRGSFRARKKKKKALPPEFECSFDIIVSKRAPRKEAKYRQIILGKSSATTSPPLISSCLPYLPTPGDFYCSSNAQTDTRTMAGEEGGEKDGTGGDGNRGKQE